MDVCYICLCTQYLKQLLMDLDEMFKVESI